MKRDDAVDDGRVSHAAAAADRTYAGYCASFTAARLQTGFQSTVRPRILAQRRLCGMVNGALSF